MTTNNQDWIFRLKSDGNAEAAVATASSELTKDVNKLTQELAILKAEFQNGYIAAQVAVGDAMEASGTFNAMEAGSMAAGSFLVAASSAKGMYDAGTTHGAIGKEIAGVDKGLADFDEEEKALDEGVTGGLTRPTPLTDAEKTTMRRDIGRRRNKLISKKEALERDLKQKSQAHQDSSQKRQGISQALQFAAVGYAKDQQGSEQGKQSREQAIGQTETELGQTVNAAKSSAQQTAKEGIQISGSVYAAAINASKA